MASGHSGRIITPTVWVLSVVSLLADIASECLYPVMPLYLREIGFSIFLIGILEGIAEATAGISKGYFGGLSDRSGRRLPFVRSGYLLSAVSKPLMVLSAWPLWVFAARTLDRLGKGFRTGARDAMLSDEARPETKARVFGFHRGMDTLGAVIGPLLAMAYLARYPGEYATMFLLALIPGLAAVGVTFFLREKRKDPRPPRRIVSFFEAFRYFRTAPFAYRRLTTGLLVFTLFNSSDMFLLLQARAAGLDDRAVIGLYVLFNLAYSLLSFPAGTLADRYGLKTTYLCGLLVFVLVYASMAFASGILMLAGVFALYGLYYATTEGISKAWISNIAAKTETATAIGSFAGLQSLVALLASSLTGLVWYRFGPQAAFLLSAAGALVAFALLTRIRQEPDLHQ